MTTMSLVEYLPDVAITTAIITIAWVVVKLSVKETEDE